MNKVQHHLQEANLLRWSGLSAIAGSIVFIAVFIIVGVFVGEDPTELEGWVTRFPDIRLAKTFENGLYLLSLVLWIPSFIGLYHLLKSNALASALFGTATGIIGLVIMSAGALTHVATAPLSEIYQSGTLTATDQATIALLWQASWGIFDALLIAGLFFIPFALLFYGFAMRNHSDLGNRYSWLSLFLGIASLVAIVITLFEPATAFAAIVVFSLIIFHATLGWKMLRLSAQA